MIASEIANGRGKFTIDQEESTPINLALGENGYITQGDSIVIVERSYALALSDKLAAWGAQYLKDKAP